MPTYILVVNRKFVDLLHDVPSPSRLKRAKNNGKLKKKNTAHYFLLKAFITHK